MKTYYCSLIFYNLLCELIIIMFSIYSGRENEAKGRITQRKGGSKAQSCQ